MINFSDLKRLFIFNFIGSVVVAAVVAVVTVLVGHFNEVTTRVFITLGMVIVHSLISLLFIWDDSKRDTHERLSLFINTVFLLIVASFITSLFAVWKIFPLEVVGHIYQTFFIIAFAALHTDILSKASGKAGYMDTIIYINYATIALVVCVLQPIIYVSDASVVLGEMYYRILAALSIIDGTLSILTIIFYKLHLHQHPEATENVLQSSVPVPPGQAPRKHMSAWVWVLIIYLVFQILTPLFFGVLRLGFGSRY
jgi:hypothetical protein